MTAPPAVVAYLVAVFPKVSETFILGEVRELMRQGVDVTLFSLRPPRVDGPRHPGTDEVLRRTVYVPAGGAGVLRLLLAVVVTLVRTPARGSSVLAATMRDAVRDRTHRDLVRFAHACYVRPRLPQGCTHLHAHYAHGPATAARLLSALTGVPYSFTAHARDIFELAGPRVLRRNVTFAAAVVTVSEHGQAYVGDVVGTEQAAKVVVIRNGLDLDRFAPRVADPPGPPVVLAVSRLVAKKGLDTLLDACAILRADGLPVRCRIVGEGPLGPALAEQASRLGLADCVEFAGSLDLDGVLAAYRGAHVFALPCRRDASGDQDGLPVSLVEAMAVGVPVVSTWTAGVPEVVDDGVSGLLVAPDDPAALAGALARVLRDPALGRALAVAAHDVATTYDRRVWVRRLRAVQGDTTAVEAVPHEVTSGAHHG